MTKPRFLNVDLLLRHPSGLRRLVRAFGEKMFVLNEEDGFAALELNGVMGTPNAILEGLVRRVEGLSPAARSIWDHCSERTFDIGIQSGLDYGPGKFRISRRALAAVQKVGGTITITVYGRGSEVPPERRRPPSVGYLASDDARLGDERRLYRERRKKP